MFFFVMRHASQHNFALQAPAADKPGVQDEQKSGQGSKKAAFVKCSLSG